MTSKKSEKSEQRHVSDVIDQRTKKHARKYNRQMQRDMADGMSSQEAMGRRDKALENARGSLEGMSRKPGVRYVWEAKRTGIWESLKIPRGPERDRVINLFVEERVDGARQKQERRKVQEIRDGATEEKAEENMRKRLEENRISFLAMTRKQGCLEQWYASRSHLRDS